MSSRSPELASSKNLSFPFLLVFLLLAWVGVWGAFWLIPTLFHKEVDSDHEGSLKMARGIVTLVAFAVVILASLLHAPSPLESLEDELDDQSAWLEPFQRERFRLRFLSQWYIRMRWVAIISASFLLILSIGFLGWLPVVVIPPLFSILALLLVFNLLLQRLLKRGKLPKHILLVQVFTDLFVLAAMLHFSGGLENPLVILLLFHVIIAGIILTPRECYLVAAMASGLIGVIALVEWAGISEHYTLAIIPHGHDHDMHASKDAGYAASLTAIYSIAFFLAAYFTSKITSQSRANEERSHAIAIEKIETQKILEQSLDSTETAIRVLDRRRRTKWKNRIWDRWFSKGWEAFPELGEAEEDEFRDRGVRSVEVESSKETGGRWFRMQFAAIEDPEKDILQIVELATDISREKEEQAQMIRAEQLAAVGKLASHVAHEVNNPITIMGAKARLLLSKFGGELPEKVCSDLQKIADLADRVAEIARGLLSYSRPSPKQKVRFDLRKALRGSLELVRQELQRKQARSTLELPEEACRIDGNEGELSQVFLNLLVNAADAIPEGGEVAIRLEREARGGRDGFVVRIQDSGPGVPPEIREKIFEPFFSTKERHKGTGLGLSICYGLVKSHGGTLELESPAMGGANFVLWIPEAMGESKQ